MKEEQPKTNELVVPNEVVNEEYVARVVFDPLYVQDGKLGRSAFELRNTKKVPNEQYVSVNRMSYWNVTDEIQRFPTPKGNIVGGYAKMLVEDIRSISKTIGTQTIDVDVKAEKGRNSRSSHAGVFTLVNSKIISGAITKHVGVAWVYVQTQLVNVAEYVQFSQKSPET